jgi:aerobic-type carbon monoxide dehydrogenase small subunit (CoxS/CutS family)
MAASALLAWNDDPSDGDIRRALSGQRCRCGAQHRMIRAVQDAATRIRGGAE